MFLCNDRQEMHIQSLVDNGHLRKIQSACGGNQSIYSQVLCNTSQAMHNQSSYDQQMQCSQNVSQLAKNQIPELSVSLPYVGLQATINSLRTGEHISVILSDINNLTVNQTTSIDIHTPVHCHSSCILLSKTNFSNDNKSKDRSSNTTRVELSCVDDQTITNSLPAYCHYGTILSDATKLPLNRLTLSDVNNLTFNQPTDTGKSNNINCVGVFTVDKRLSDDCHSVFELSNTMKYSSNNTANGKLNNTIRVRLSFVDAQEITNYQSFTAISQSLVSHSEWLWKDYIESN